MTEIQAQTSTYGEVTQAGIALVRVLGDLGKTWLLSRNEQRRAANQQPAPTQPSPDAAIRTAGVSQAASASVVATKLSSTVPAPARVSQDATAEERARALAERARAEERVRALAEHARAEEAKFQARLAEMKVLLDQFLAAQRAPAPSPPEAQAARTEAATVPSPPAAQPLLQVNAGHAVITPSTVADVIPIAVPFAAVPHSPPIDTSPAIETPAMPAAESPAKAETASQDVARTEQHSDGASQEATSAQAARTATTEKPAETAPNPPQTTPEPELTPAQRRAKWLIECKDPHVQSWRTIKRFVRRMTDLDLLMFTSSVPMFRAFLAMLRGMTPYYEGPKFSLDELVPDGMPLSSAMTEQTA